MIDRLTMLSYESKHRRRRRRTYLIGALAAVPLLLLARYRSYLPFVVHNFRIRQVERRWSSVRPPEMEVVYDEDASRARDLRSRGSQYVDLSPTSGQPAVARSTDWFDTYWRLQGVPMHRKQAPLFAGSLTASSGAERIVFVGYGWSEFGPMRYECIAKRTKFCSPDADFTSSGSSGAYEFDVARPRNLRFFAGRRDPFDSSHFSIRFECDGAPGIIDGWLQWDAQNIEWRVQGGSPKSLHW